MKANSHKVRVAIVCGTMNIGGGETMAAKLAGYIDRSKFDVKYFVISKYIENQIAQSLHDSGTDFQCLALPNSFDFRSYKVFSDALQSFSPDVIHCHLDVSYSWVWALLHNKPLITTMHSDPYRRYDKRVAAMIRMKSMQGKLRIIGCAKIIRDLVAQCYHVKASQMGYIYNPISVSDFVPSKAPSGQIEFVAMGRLHEVKNYPLMLQAFKNVAEQQENVHLSIAGVGPQEEELRGLALELGIAQRLTFLGNVQNVPELLSRMDVLLLSSVSEACPMVILEAMAAGLPVIATSVGGVPELVTDNGIVVPSGDAEAFSAAMKALATDPELRQDMGKRARSYAVKYDKNVIAAQYEKEYMNLVSRGK